MKYVLVTGERAAREDPRRHCRVAVSLGAFAILQRNGTESFAAGGVVSGLGKGVTASSIGVLLKACGHRVTSIKVDKS